MTKTSVTGCSCKAFTTRWLIRPVQFRVTADAELRNAADRSAPVVARLPRGTVVERAGKRNCRWMRVRHGPTWGWVAERLLEKVGEPEPHGGQLTTETKSLDRWGSSNRCAGNRGPLGWCSIPRREVGAGALVWHLLSYELMPLLQRQVAQNRATHQITQHLGVDDPEAHRSILAPGGQHLPIGAEGDSKDTGLVAAQDLRCSSGSSQIPKPDGVIPTSSGKRLPVRANDHG